MDRASEPSYADLFASPVFTYDAKPANGGAGGGGGGGGGARTARPFATRARRMTDAQVSAYAAMRAQTTDDVRDWEPDVTWLRAVVNERMGVTVHAPPRAPPVPDADVDAAVAWIADTPPARAPPASTPEMAPRPRNPRAPTIAVRDTARFEDAYPDIPTTLAQFDARVRDWDDIARLLPLIGYRPRANTSLTAAIATARAKFANTVDHGYAPRR